jgi:hypothetical protein
MFHVHRYSVKDGARGIRTFIHLYDHEDGKELAEASCEAYIASGARSTGTSLELGSTASVKLFVGVAHVFNVWLKVGSGRLAASLYRKGGATYARSQKLTDKTVVSVRIHGGSIWWELWQKRHEWHSSTPRWRSGNFNPTDWALGRRVYSEQIVEGPVEVVVPMPEGSYPAIVTIKLCTWKRPRWAWPTHRHTYNIDVLKPDGEPNGYIPVPGKGENSWDCGPDGIFSQSGSGRTIESAIAGIVGGSLAERRRRGVDADYAEPIS